MSDAPWPCEMHPDLVSFKYPLPHLREALEHKRKIKVVAIGSSSTAGEGDIVPYPARLELLLRASFHHRMIDVLNRGIGGQEAPAELSRFEPDVFAEAPALVIWQVGTNAVFRKDEFNFDDVADSIVNGLRWLADMPTDVIMMDLQYTTAVVKDGKLQFSEDIVKRVAAAAEHAGANVFRRFDLMRHWVDHDHIPIEKLERDGDENRLHMSEWATHCVTLALFQSIRRALEADAAT
jgi:acyl-CoA thioesterase-1